MLRRLLQPLLRPLLYRLGALTGSDVSQQYALRQRDGSVIADRAGNIIQLRG